MHRLAKFAPLLFALGVLLALLAAILYKALARTEGHLVYALDDPYIHMAMAKNLAQYGVWGITRYEFTSATSSPLWTFLIAVFYFLAGVHDFVPFVLATVSAILVLVVAFRILRQHHRGLIAITLFLSGLVIFTPLPTLVFVGQEHALHLALTLLIAFLAARSLSNKASPPPPRLFFFLIPLLVLTRYEGLFLVLVIAALFFLRRRWTDAFITLLLGVIPVVLYGAFSVANGWNWLPNPILIKSAPSTNPLALFQNFAAQLTLAPALGGFILFGSIVLVLNRQIAFWRTSNILLILFFATTLLHLTFARVGWFYRYEAYLIGFGWLACGVAVLDLLPRLDLVPPQKRFAPALVLLSLLIVTVIPLEQRAFDAVRYLPYASQNVYEQQYQLGTFLRRYYTGATVLLNDVGAVSYLADVHVIDVIGLATRYTAEQKWQRQELNNDALAAYAAREHAQLALLYDSLYTRDGQIQLPAQWTRLARWTIQNNVVVSDATVSIYAVAPNETEPLKIHLEEFSLTMPETIQQEYP